MLTTNVFILPLNIKFHPYSKYIYVYHYVLGNKDCNTEWVGGVHTDPEQGIGWKILPIQTVNGSWKSTKNVITGGKNRNDPMSTFWEKS